MALFKYEVDLKELEGKDFAFEVGGFVSKSLSSQVDRIFGVYVKDGKLVIEGENEE